MEKPHWRGYKQLFFSNALSCYISFTIGRFIYFCLGWKVLFQSMLNAPETPYVSPKYRIRGRDHKKYKQSPKTLFRPFKANLIWYDYLIKLFSPDGPSWLLTRLPPAGSAALLADSPAPHIWREKMSGIPSCCTTELKKGSKDESG